MADDSELQEGPVNPDPEEEEQQPKIDPRLQNTASDWIRDMRMSADVNKTTVGVDTDMVTPELLIATSRKLLDINRRKVEQDPKDSLQFQRVYGPQEFFSEHIMRDGDRVARQLLWKATNKGNLDFMQVGALDQHVSDVFNNSKLANMVDASSPLETVDASYKITRIGEGGIADISSAPDEMRLVQPSFLGYIDPVRGPECYAEDTELMTVDGWKRISDISCQDRLACLIDGRIEFHRPEAVHSYAFNGLMYGYEDNGGVSYLVTPNHRMWSRCTDPKRDGTKCNYNIKYASDVHTKARTVRTGGVLPVLGQEVLTSFSLPPVSANLKRPQVYGNPPQGASLKRIGEIDINDFAEFLGWYLSEGSFTVDYGKGHYRANIAQSAEKNPDNFNRIRELVKRLPFGSRDQEHRSKKTVFVNRKQVVMYLSQFGKSADKFIPDWLFTAPLSARRRFREALLAGDGRQKRHLCTMSHRLAKDFERLQFGLGESVVVVHEPETRIPGHPGIWVVYWHRRTEGGLQKPGRKRGKGVGYFTQNYGGTVYCPTVPGGLVYCRRNNHNGFWCGNSIRVGLDAYIAKNVMKGSDGKLYQKFINARTGKEELVDSVTAAKSVVTTADMMNVKANHCFAVGGKTGVRIVKKSDVDYYLPHMDDAFSIPANLVTGMSGVKEMRLLMGCLHPMTPLVVVSKRNEVDIIKASDAWTDSGSVPGTDASGAPGLYKIRTVVAKLPPNRSTFRKVVLRSGRALITSRDHRWPVLRHGKVVQVQAERLRKGDQVLRSMFTDLPSRRMFINEILLNKDMAVLLGYAVRSLQNTAAGSSIVFMHRHLGQVERALKKFNINGRIKTGRQGYDTLTVADGDWFEGWLTDNVCYTAEYRRVPSCILSSGAALCAEFLDAYSADETLVGIDSKQCYWLLELPNAVLRDGIALVLARTGVDTLYRDAVQRNGNRQLALKLVDSPKLFGSMVLDEVKTVFIAQQAALMIDLDIDDNMFAAANGVVTHNSKYPLQALSVDGREAPLVRGVDSASGVDMSTLVGKYCGARFAKKPGRVVAVRKDRIDLQYDDGTTGRLELYHNFPMNNKGFLTNTPRVKAGDTFKAGSLLASSNYTDDKGVEALGANLRTAWISWKGGTYEDAVVLSESAAKKMAATTMYSTDLDLDKTITLGKRNFLSWKPGDFTKEQLENLDDDGVVRPGTVLHQGDPMVLAVQTTEPSPGTLGKKVLTDVSQTWEHPHPGTVTDVVRTRKGVKVLATVTTPVEVGDKLSGCYDDKTEIFTRRGFVPLSLLSGDDEVAVLHPDGSASFEIPRARQVDWYEGCMVGYKSKRADFLVTPDHDMAFVPRYMYEKGSSTLIKRKAAHVYKQRIAMRVSACFDGVLARPAETEIRLAEPSRSATGSRHATKARLKNVFRRDDFAAFLGLYLAEGHCARSGKERWVRIAQHDDVDGGEARCASIRALLDRMGLEYHYYDHQYFMISNWPLHSYVEPFHNSYGKFIPDEVFTSWSKREMQLLLEWYYLGDGEKTHKGTSRCATVSSRLADGLQRLYILTGNYSVVHSTRAANAKSGRVFKVSASAKVFNMVGGDKSGWYVKTDYAGYIYCVSTSTGVVLTRRNGVSVWNGQCYGNKGVCSMVLPDDQMPCDKDGRPFEMLLSPLGLVSRTNASQLHEAMLGKVARKTGHYETLPAFMEDGSSMKDYVLARLKQAHVSADDDLYDPENGRKIPNVVNGVSYIYRLKHLADSKMSARGTNAYSTDETPGGSGYEGSKRLGMLEVGAMVSHGAFDNLIDAKLIRGQSNADFWRQVRTGGVPTIPGEPLVQKKFFAHLQGAGVNVRKTAKGISVFAMTNDDVRDLAGPREVKSDATYEAKNFRPIDGGLFGNDVFGVNGTHWGYIQLDEPLPNPVMEEPLARLLRMSEKDFVAVAAGEKEVNGLKSSTDIRNKLATIDIEQEAKQAQKEFKDAPASRKDNALKRYVAVERMRRQGVQPAEYMLDRIPVLPPVYRPISTHSGVTMVADANYLYKQLLDARDDLREAGDLPKEFQDRARAGLYRSWKELTGMYDPEDVKLRNKNVGGLLKWALGTGGPKWSSFQRKVLGTSVDTVGRGAIIPNSKLNVDQIGIPIPMAMDIMAPFVERSLVKRGYTPLDAMKMVKKRAPQALEMLNAVIATHPVEMNRAPSLHKYSILAFHPVLVQGNAVQIHPSVCPGFGADFDGDTVNIHVPVSDNARKEALTRMLPSRNLVGVAEHKIMNKPEKEYMQGLYIATRMGQSPDGRARIFRTLDEARAAYRSGEIDIDTPIQILKR